MIMHEKEECKHKYNVDYSFRLPQPFFRSLPCDNCGCSIKLSLFWRMIYLCVIMIGYSFAYVVSTTVHIKVFGNTFVVSILVFLILIWVVNFLIGLTLKYGQWVEVNKQVH